MRRLRIVVRNNLNLCLWIDVIEIILLDVIFATRNFFLHANLLWLYDLLLKESLLWLDNLLFTKEHADCLHQPNVTGLYHRQLFKYFHDEGILFSLAKDFNYEGGFQAYWRKLFSSAKACPKDFGERPNKACFDVDADHKIQHLADPPYCPFELT